jgi:N-(2-amino-2-carboxyethyl)-L-glutamate synthase
MTIVSVPHDLIDSDLYVDLNPILGRALYLKCEGLNFGGSVKMRSAAAMIAAAERRSRLTDDTILIESSSGNLGVALSAIAASIGVRFTCVTDRHCNALTIAAMRALGAEVVVIDTPHLEGGYLKARIEWIQERCARDDRYVWLDQYTNEANWRAHYDGTARSILSTFPNLDVLFIGVGTGGTIMGCARYLREVDSRARIVAVDPVGSVAFGFPAGPRLIPGLGAGIRPPLIDATLIDDVVRVSETDTVRACRALASRGLLFGGSTGTAVSGALAWLVDHDTNRELQSVCVSADLGDRYLDTVYNDAWVAEHLGEAALQPLQGVAPARALPVR